MPRTPFETGGGTARLVGPDWVVWAKAPGRLEAGTPAIPNVVAFAKALQLVGRYGEGAFRDAAAEPATVDEVWGADGWSSLSGTELLHALRDTLFGRGYPPRGLPAGLGHDLERRSA